MVIVITSLRATANRFATIALSKGLTRCTFKDASLYFELVLIEVDVMIRNKVNYHMLVTRVRDRLNTIRVPASYFKSKSNITRVLATN